MDFFIKFACLACMWNQLIIKTHKILVIATSFLFLTKASIGVSLGLANVKTNVGVAKEFLNLSVASPRFEEFFILWLAKLRFGDMAGVTTESLILRVTNPIFKE